RNGDRVAVIVQAVNPPTGVEALRARYGLSAGEGDVVELVLVGKSTTQIAADLYLSAWTVQDRLKSVFTKTGVRSRRELTAMLKPASVPALSSDPTLSSAPAMSSLLATSSVPATAWRP
nr:helix-turn-helix transcriptional regulator [Micromonospora sp. DSM 115978]